MRRLRPVESIQKGQGGRFGLGEVACGPVDFGLQQNGLDPVGLQVEPGVHRVGFDGLHGQFQRLVGAPLRSQQPRQSEWVDPIRMACQVARPLQRAGRRIRAILFEVDHSFEVGSGLFLGAIGILWRQRVAGNLASRMQRLLEGACLNLDQAACEQVTRRYTR